MMIDLMTDYDKLLKYVRVFGKMSIKRLTLFVNLPEEQIERFLTVCEERGIVRLNYSPFNCYVKMPK